jgi:hypothetical protein
MLRLSSGEIESYSANISEILEQIPLFYITEVLELANEKRKREGEIENIDTSESEEEENFSDSETEEESEEEESDCD